MNEMASFDYLQRIVVLLSLHILLLLLPTNFQNQKTKIAQRLCDNTKPEQLKQEFEIRNCQVNATLPLRPYPSIKGIMINVKAFTDHVDQSVAEIYHIYKLLSH